MGRFADNICLYYDQVDEHNKLFKCKLCSGVFKGTSLANLGSHLFIKHKISKEDVFAGNFPAKLGIRKLKKPKIKTRSSISPTPSMKEPQELPETVEELMKEENKLLRQIVQQNQKVLSRTVEILEQNQQLQLLMIRMFKMDRNQGKNTFEDFDEDLDWNEEDPLDAERADFEDGEDCSGFLPEEEDQTYPANESIANENENDAELPDYLQFSKEVIANDEGDVEMQTEEVEENLEDSKDFIHSNQSEPQPGASTEYQKTSAKGSQKSKNPHRKFQLRMRSSNPIDRIEKTITFPIDSFSELKKIDQLMMKNGHFKQSVEEHLSRIISEDSETQLVTKSVLEEKCKADIATGAIWNESLFLNAAQIPGYQAYKDHGIWEHFYRSTDASSACCRFVFDDGQVCGKILLLGKANTTSSLNYHAKVFHKIPI